MVRATRSPSILRDQRGSVLLSGLFLVVAMTFLGVALLQAHVMEHRLVTEDERQVQAFYAAEAGLQRAWWDLSNLGFGTTSFDTIVGAGIGASTTLYGQAGDTTNALTTAESIRGGSSYTVVPSYTVAAKALSNSLIAVTSTGSVSTATPGGSAVATVQAQVLRTGTLLPVFGADYVNIQGGQVDSYDTRACTPSPCAYGATLPGGATNVGKSGDVISNGSITLTQTVIDGNVTGTTDVPADPSDISVDSNTTVNGNVTSGGTVCLGSTCPYPSSATNINGTITAGDALPKIQTPSVPACSPYTPAPGAGNVWISSSVACNSVKGSACYYDPTTGDLSISGGITANLSNGTYCFHNVTVSGNSTLQIGGPVVLSVNGQLDASGGSISNSTDIATNLQIYSSYASAPTKNKSDYGIALSGGSDAYMTVYSPQAQISLSGGSNYYGALVGKSVDISGGVDVHYDLALGSPSAGLAYGVYTFKLQSWQRCKNASCT